MGWCSKIRFNLDCGGEEIDDYFEVNFSNAQHFASERFKATVRPFTHPFIYKSLRQLKPMHKLVHQAVIEEYKKFVSAVKGVIPIQGLIRTLWCFAATPAFLATRAMCELHDGFTKSFPNPDDRFGFLEFTPALQQFRERLSRDLVTGDEHSTWVGNACKRVANFEKVMRSSGGTS